MCLNKEEVNRKLHFFVFSHPSDPIQETESIIILRHIKNTGAKSSSQTR